MIIWIQNFDDDIFNPKFYEIVSIIGLTSSGSFEFYMDNRPFNKSVESFVSCFKENKYEKFLLTNDDPRLEKNFVEKLKENGMSDDDLLKSQDVNSFEEFYKKKSIVLLFKRGMNI